MNEQIFAPIQTKQENCLLDLDLQHTDEELTLDRDISSERHHIRENVSFNTLHSVEEHHEVKSDAGFPNVDSDVDCRKSVSIIESVLKCHTHNLHRSDDIDMR
jgi:hypothetical protein